MIDRPLSPMRPQVVTGLSIAMAGAGFVAGMAVARPSAPDNLAPAPSGAASRGPGVDRRRGASDDPRSQRGHPRARTSVEATEFAASTAAVPETPGSQPRPIDDEGTETDEDGELVGDSARAPALVDAAETCVELLGKPIEPREDVHPRFSGPSMSRAVSQAVEQAGVPGDVEGVDCSEFPCIVFGRLAGDEEDVEAIERSAALDPYEDDVLTLLLWATTVDENARTHPSAKETGLFALAYYDFDDRAEIGEDLDRRIRARVLEVWNAERPGPAGGPAL